jgi:hypothetical protein
MEMILLQVFSIDPDTGFQNTIMHGGWARILSRHNTG